MLIRTIEPDMDLNATQPKHVLYNLNGLTRKDCIHVCFGVYFALLEKNKGLCRMVL